VRLCVAGEEGSCRDHYQLHVEMHIVKCYHVSHIIPYPTYPYVEGKTENNRPSSRCLNVDKLRSASASIIDYSSSSNFILE
jgi:hypothetical protein